MPESGEGSAGAAPKKIGGKLKATVTKKVGPLPLWGWAVIGGGVLFVLMRKRKGSSSTQGGALTVAAPEPMGGGGIGGSGSGLGGGGSDIVGAPTSPPISTPNNENPSPIPTPTSIDNRPAPVKLPSKAAIVAPTPEEIAYALNRKEQTTGAEQAQWTQVTQEHTQRLAASLNQTPQGRQQLQNVNTAYHTNATAAQTFFEQCAKNPEGCNRMFGNAA